MLNLKNKKILIFQQRGWALNIGHFLAKKFQAEGCSLAAITLKKITHKFIIEQTEVKYAEILNVDDILEYPEKYLGKEKITFTDICRELKLDSVWPLIYADRWLVRSYGEKYYYSYRQHVTDEFIIAYITAHYKALRDLIKSFKPDIIIIATFVYEGHVLLSLLGDKYGIPTISITDSKVPGYNMFARDYLDRGGELILKAKELNKGKTDSANREKARQFISDFKEKFQAPHHLKRPLEENIFKKIRHELRPLKLIYEWYTKPSTRANRIKTIGPTVDYRPPKLLLRDHFCQKKYLKYAQNFSYYPFEKVGKFVFFPLQFTPEASADLMCPLFNNQVETARQIAMSLPDDYTLVVKEHPDMVGLRSPSYLKTIARTANVKLIDYRISSEEVFKKADLLVANYSTTIFEAAIYGKPAIVLGDTETFKLLPNVINHTDMQTMAAVIKRALALDTSSSEYQRRLENYIAAVFDIGFDFKYMKAWERGGEDIEELWRLYKNEIERVLNLKN
ncbi:CDP-glycerol glycerophosphotransferase family protein [Candidatus Falkowbacteria bacterium]|nr:CDP-glycerol glycerophosphotransferase family protein [Candidatus Falkowbacteria bacterium]